MSALLLTLPEDAARALGTFLDAHDLEHVTSVSRAAARDSCFQRRRDASAVTLTLPSDANDPDRCRRLLQGMHRRNPQRLSSLVWIRVVAPWQVEVMLEDPAIAECVESVSCTIATTDPRIVRQLCDKLCDFPNLRNLNMSSLPLDTVDAISRMKQLRRLDLSRTNVVNASALAALDGLEQLILERTVITDLGFIQHLTNLEVVQVSLDTERDGSRSRRGHRLVVPPLRRLLRLHTLVLEKFAVEGMDELLHVAPVLRNLELRDVHHPSSDLDMIHENTRPPRCVDGDELADRFAQLETINLVYQDVINPEPSTISRIVNLRALEHSVCKDFGSLAALTKLEELKLSLPVARDYPNFMREDYTFLLQLPQLRKITIDQNTMVPSDWPADMPVSHEEFLRQQASPLAVVLPRLPHLTSLVYNGYILNNDFLPSLKHLQHLTLQECIPELMSFDWIRGFESLRSLDITLSTESCDLSAIGEVSTLESFRLFDTWYRSWDNTPLNHYGFLSRLVNLKSLDLIADMDDLDPLLKLSKLESLSVDTNAALSDGSALRTLDSLRTVDIACTKLRDVSSLASLPRLREAFIPCEADCRPLVGGGGPPRLLRVKHGHFDCLQRCQFREAILHRELEGTNSDGDRGAVMFGSGTEDY